MTEESILSPEETAPETTEETTSAAAPAAADPDLQREIAELREQIAESNRTAAFWAEQARAGVGAPAAAPAPAAPEPEDDTDVLEAITTHGAKGFDALAEKRGFIRRSEVEQMIENRASAMTSTLSKENELLGRYPDLRNRNSDFFKTTAAHYGDLYKAGTPQLLAMELASEKAELDFMRAGKITTPDKENRERDRQARIAAQGGGGGPRRPAGAETDDEQISDFQKRVADGMGITYEAYMKRAKAGVRMGGKVPR